MKNFARHACVCHCERMRCHFEMRTTTANHELRNACECHCASHAYVIERREHEKRDGNSYRFDVLCFHLLSCCWHGEREVRGDCDRQPPFLRCAQSTVSASQRMAASQRHRAQLRVGHRATVNLTAKKMFAHATHAFVIYEVHAFVISRCDENVTHAFVIAKCEHKERDGKIYRFERAHFSFRHAAGMEKVKCAAFSIDRKRSLARSIGSVDSKRIARFERVWSAHFQRSATTSESSIKIGSDAQQLLVRGRRNVATACVVLDVEMLSTKLTITRSHLSECTRFPRKVDDRKRK